MQREINCIIGACCGRADPQARNSLRKPSLIAQINEIKIPGGQRKDVRQILKIIQQDDKPQQEGNLIMQHRQHYQNDTSPHKRRKGVEQNRQTATRNLITKKTALGAGEEVQEMSDINYNSATDMFCILMRYNTTILRYS